MTGPSSSQFAATAARGNGRAAAWRRCLSAVMTIGAAVVLSGAGLAGAQTTSMVSIGTGGVLPDCVETGTYCFSYKPDVTPDGRYVVFVSAAETLIPGPVPHSGTQILRHDRQTCTTDRLSVAATGEPANSSSEEPSISADGQVVAFSSNASNLAPDTTPGLRQVYIHDGATSAVRLISLSLGGTPGNDDSDGAEISADGRWVVFHSSASNLVNGDANGLIDIFLHDRDTDTLRLLSVSDSGEQANGRSQRPGADPTTKCDTHAA